MRRKSQPTNNPTANPISGAKDTSVVMLTTMPTANPISAPATRNTHILPRAISAILVLHQWAVKFA
jgi:hypothetical protein